MLVQTVSFADFIAAFDRHGRLDQFESIEGLRLVFNYLVDTAHSHNTPIVLDVIAICVSYEVINLEESLNGDYGVFSSPEELLYHLDEERGILAISKGRKLVLVPSY